MEGWEDHSSNSYLTDELTNNIGLTTLSITLMLDREKEQQKSVKGWDKVLKGLKEIIFEK